MLFNVCFILGGPGAGKGTVCQKIVDDHGFIHLSAGELLRQACDSPNSPYRDEIQQHMKNGTIVPAKVTCGLLHHAMLEGFKNAGCTNYLIDGFPRNDDNRTCWEEDMNARATLRRVIVLDCPDDVSL
ncbi:unnamed protein product [Echinostoma caproni]|uniref:Nucleoside-diphosphate kinase n=1 Tax=Echinostoma caproni TaxID=27848 RepID=A0A183AIY7_9TREM|nr:unnamed protein product [Echinostoma caproni]